MKKEIKKVPTIRFKGFTDDWEQRKFSDVIKTRRGLTYKPTDVTEIGIRVLRSSNINEDCFEIHDDDVFVNEDVVNIPYAKNGDILITSANGSSRLIGKHAIIHDIQEKSIVHGGFMLIASSDEPEFINASMSSPWYTKFINVFVSGGNGAIGNLSKADLDEQHILIPCKEERKKIGSYFSNLDNLITLHQRKLKQLQALKKYFLQNMFPAKEEKVPAIRFKGFTGDWEQKKITDISKIFIGLVTTMTENYRDQGTLLIRNSDIRENQFSFSNTPIFLKETFAEENKTRRLKLGDVITVHTGDIGTSAIITKNEVGAIGFATINTRPNKEILDSYYLAAFFNTKQHKTYALRMATGDGRSNYNLKDFKKLVIPLPSIAEQKKIGGCFQNLYHLIIFQQHKINQLQSLKKFMLQNLFI